ncbi:hypothetical protein DesyoDRAFT_2870 [Desulfosporosinus youngiae DSM 17734]|uniref:Uncharacterized protein n=1 Tax=Desulfosporosinus youngiae DSM 17734 TaxID=768710 RepID=H5Y490_9FIRM|nr:hypothetical protein DesyoDRAFT_2870 [Desulfosporosinus youngiae DSM 17734]
MNRIGNKIITQKVYTEDNYIFRVLLKLSLVKHTVHYPLRKYEETREGL